MNKQEKELVELALTRFKAVLENLECECTENHKCTIHNDLILVDNALAGLSFNKKLDKKKLEKFFRKYHAKPKGDIFKRVSFSLVQLVDLLSTGDIYKD